MSSGCPRFRFAYAVKDAFTHNSPLSDLKNLDDKGWVPSGYANSLVANHDTERVRPPLSCAFSHIQLTSDLPAFRTPAA